MRFSSLLAAAALSLSVNALPEGTFIQVGIIHPRNTTYITAEVFPIAFQIQYSDFTLPPSSELNILWGIMPYGSGITPGGTTLDSGTVRSNHTGSQSPYLVATTNTTEWAGRLTRDDRYMLKWDLRFDSCGDEVLARGELMFNIATEAEATTYAPGEVHRVMDVPLCPEFGAIIEYQNNATESQCPIGDMVQDAEGDPCYRTSGNSQDAFSRILSQASQLAAPTSTITSATSTSSAGVGPARTVQTALAAACLLGGLAL